MAAMPKNVATSQSAARSRLRVVTVISAAPSVRRARMIKMACCMNAFLNDNVYAVAQPCCAA